MSCVPLRGRPLPTGRAVRASGTRSATTTLLKPCLSNSGPIRRDHGDHLWHPDDLLEPNA
jgi:hypothetical protein